MTLDPRLYGLAPVERDAHEGVQYLTMAGLMKRLNVRSETTIRSNRALMAMRRTLSPGVHRWIPAEVDAYVAGLATPPEATSRRAGHKQIIAKARRQRDLGYRKTIAESRNAALRAKVDEKMKLYREGKLA